MESNDFCIIRSDKDIPEKFKTDLKLCKIKDALDMIKVNDLSELTLPSFDIIHAILDIEQSTYNKMVEIYNTFKFILPDNVKSILFTTKFYAQLKIDSENNKSLYIGNLEDDK